VALHSVNLQTSIFSTLTGGTLTDISGTSITSKVFDDVPEGTAYPYVVIGEETAIPVGAKDTDGHEHTLTFHVWSQYRGRKEIKQIMQQIYTLLHNVAISITGATLVNIRHEFERTLLESDGITRHGVIRFRAVVFD
tara:strand:+ start:679 stop:1089 length:411 start_codon:yes stop_codon:yes gene_type:complete